MPSPQDILRPYLAGPVSAEGECDMYCPLHPDRKRSASVNFKKRKWYCHAGCGGGALSSLLKQRSRWVPPPGSPRAKDEPEGLREDQVAEYHARLVNDETLLDDLLAARWINLDTAIANQLGWDDAAVAFTLPIRSADGRLTNVRRYQPHPPEGRRKIWSVKGHGAPSLYPIAQLLADPDSIIVCEGEWDALLTIQNGFEAVTRTGAADVWRGSWSPLFRDRVVYLAHDCDTKGQIANAKVAAALAPLAAEVRVVKLPYGITDDHGKDLTDFWKDGHTRDEFARLLDTAPLFDAEREDPEVVDPSDAEVLDSFDSSRYGKPMRLTVTVKGRREPGYTIPRTARLSCTRDAGPEKCPLCPLYGDEGEAEVEVSPDDPIALEMIDSTEQQVNDMIRRRYGALKCSKLTIEQTDHSSVEILFARPSVEHMNGSPAGAYKSIKLTSVGRHDTMPSSTVQAVGALRANPRSQLNEFLAWEVRPLETSIDTFKLTPEAVRAMKKFRPKRGQTPLQKLGEIARDLSEHVTRIRGRPELHALLDLVWHSTIAFYFGGDLEARGWLQALVVGDTRTGKSEAATRLARHYGAGEIVSCESASYAGIVGGLQQFGAAKEWAVTWGVVPLNDRRLVVLDEISGMSHDDIGAMSDIRSRGVAELTKIQQERTYARTRMVWMGNPRDRTLAHYTWGVQAIMPLIGRAEDIARFDLAMSIKTDEVDSRLINQPYPNVEPTHSAEASRTLVRWVWSRTAENVVWDEGAEQAVYDAAIAMGDRYVEDPPLVQAASIRTKIARVAVALAARLFSTDESYENILVKPEHVRDAVAFMDRVYSMTNFGYAARSAELLRDAREASTNVPEARHYLMERAGLGKFLRSRGSFRRSDLEDVLNMTREEATAVMNRLWELRMIDKQGADVRVGPALHDLLKEIDD